ncbi:hypothetical protein Tco_0926378 [Tanacetum coccineum]|uniref:Uncharacterized protein n=1 Tax=Tanacetum coccineum TaxID=301880 RepID=A0ABQ5DAJ1_9ASTR
MKIAATPSRFNRDAVMKENILDNGLGPTVEKFLSNVGVEFDIEIRDKKGAENLAADHLSRLENPDLEKLTKAEIRDLFLEERLMAISDKNNELSPLQQPHHRATIPFLGHLKDNGYDEKEVLMKLKKLQDNSTKSATTLNKLLKEKLRVEEEIKATMNVHCPTTLKDALASKEKDSGGFTLPCSINNVCFDKALADFGVSVSVMPYSTFTNLDFAIVENMDAYRDKDMGDIIVEKPFCRVACIEAKREVLNANEESGGMYIIWNLMCVVHASIEMLFATQHT